MRQPSTDFLYFNPRLREGGDNSTRLSINSCFVFQSTPPRRRRLFHLVNLLLYKEISIHASEKEATGTSLVTYEAQIFQSTPPRKRRLQHIVIPQLSCTYLVSTTFLSAIFSFISQYIVLFFLF